MENFETFTDAYGWFIASGGATIVLSWLLAKIDVWVEWKHKFKGTLYNFLLAATVTGVTALYEAVPAETLAAIEKY